MGSTWEAAALNEGKPGKGRNGRSGAKADGTRVIGLSLRTLVPYEITANCIRDKRNVD